ncbi:MAG: TlyA family RNA methyltransferase [Candidatus Dependentiae bacterium]
MKKIRLDQLIQEKYPQYSRRQIQSWIMQRKVMVDDKIVDKAGTQVRPDVQLDLSVEEPKFVGRAGFKLEKALDHFNIDVAGLVVLDAGLSTGGFTDCLLQRGAKEIFGVDVGHGQVHEKIRQNERVHVMERTNLRYITPETIGVPIDLITLDLSFISILKVMDAIDQLLKVDGLLVTLIKPQFEAEKHQVGKGGIIKDQKVHDQVIEKVTDGIMQYGYELIGVTESPILGTEGNKEFLAAFKKRRRSD